MTHDAYLEEKIKSTLLPHNKSPKKKIKRHKIENIEWLNDPNRPVRGETALWVAVITQAMMDALSKAKNNEARYHKYEAINWLTGNSKNFVTVCLNAGLDPNYVRRKAKRAIASPTLWRAEPGKGKRYNERKAYRKRIKSSRPEEREPSSDAAKNNVITGPWVAAPQPAYVQNQEG